MTKTDGTFCRVSFNIAFGSDFEGSFFLKLVPTPQTQFRLLMLLPKVLSH